MARTNFNPCPECGGMGDCTLCRGTGFRFDDNGKPWTIVIPVRYRFTCDCGARGTIYDIVHHRMMCEDCWHFYIVQGAD